LLELREKEEKEQREKEEKKNVKDFQTRGGFSPNTPYMVETESLKRDCNNLNCCFHLHHNYAFS